MHSSLLIYGWALLLLPLPLTMVVAESVVLSTSSEPTRNRPPESAAQLGPQEISYLVLSQAASYHAKRAQALRRSILEQQSQLVNFGSHTTRRAPLTATVENVHLSHELFADHEGSWAITPVLRHIRANILKASHTAGTRWLIICEEDSHVNVSLLARHLGRQDYRQELFLGYPLHDQEATIIHHFAFFKNPSSFLYPYLRAGVALTVPLVDRLIQRLGAVGSTLTEFFIDVAHEFALLAWNRGHGTSLTPVSYLCARPGQGCAVFAGQQQSTVAGAGGGTCNHHGHPPVAAPAAPPADQILFAVKTCEKFHADRVPVLLHTWAKYVRHLRIYSDNGDATIPTIATSIPNTSIGHCAKTLGILNLIREEIRRTPSHNPLGDVRWIMLVDDDTILSPSALARHLRNFSPDRDVYIGERYGYHLLARDSTGAFVDSDGQGYNYITGGGGIVLSVAILDALLQHCECPSATSPDDMILAACLFRLGVRPIHSPLFHQARPSDYPPETLDPASISFHKHWQIDPYQVYDRWFRENDKTWWEQQQQQQEDHELLADENIDDDDDDDEGQQDETEPTAKPLLQPKHISNDNDSSRHQEYAHLPRGVVSVASATRRGQSQPPDTATGGDDGGTGTTTTANDYRRFHGGSGEHQQQQQQHISKHFCESNELQSNSNLLLSQHHHHPPNGDGFQESNIIKHSEL